jgi:uncharacterized phage protein gp47/JayE
MAEILKIYTADQLYDMQRKKILASGCGLIDFNDGSKTKALLQAVSDIVSTIGMDFKEAIYAAIPIALYEGFNFNKLPAVGATGFIRPYRKPAMTISYTGSATSVTITINSTSFTAACTGAPGDAFSLDFATYPSVSDMVSAIDALANWSAVSVDGGQSDELYQYSSVELLGKVTYENVSGMDIMQATDTAIFIPQGYSITIDDMIVSTIGNNTIPAGSSGVQCSAQNNTTGTSGNIVSGAIDTESGKGSINSAITGIDGVVNDSAFSGGRAEETDEERAVRFQRTVNGLNAGTKNGIIVALEGVAGVRSVGMRTSYPFRGTNTILVDDGTGTISVALREALEKVLYGDPDDLENFPGKNAEGIGYNIEAPTVHDVSIGITATRLSNVKVELDTIKNDIKNAVEQYINTLPLGRDVILSEIVRVGKNSNLAIYDLIVDSPAGPNISIDENEVARTGAGTSGSVTVTVTISGYE